MATKKQAPQRSLPGDSGDEAQGRQPLTRDQMTPAERRRYDAIMGKKPAPKKPARSK